MPTSSRRAMWLVFAVGAATSLYCWAEAVSCFIKPGSIGLDYLGPGTDWMAMQGATELVLRHQAASALDGVALTDFINKDFAPWLWGTIDYRPFVYPPSALLVFWPFAGLAFIPSYLGFQLASAALLAGALLYRPEQRWAAPLVAAGVLLCPAASINVVSGQLGFFVAGLLVLGVRLLPVRPFLAGAVLGVLSIKPQFAVLVPFIVLARGQWVAVGGAAASACALAAVSALVFGPGLWWSWAAQVVGGMGDAQSDWVLTSRMSGGSVFAHAAHLGVPLGAASALQAAATLAAAAATVVVLRSRLPRDGQLAAVLALAFLAAPHSSHYDLVMLAAAAALWSVGQPRPGETAPQRLLLLAFWVLPLLQPVNALPLARATPLLVAGFVAAVLWPALARLHAPRGRLAPGMDG